ncbi:terminase, partial [Mycobacterium kansasii]
VAEQSAAYWSAIREGRSKDDGLLYDPREAPGDTDMSDRESLIAGLRVAYGDSSGHSGGCVIHEEPCDPGHVDLERLVATIWDP